MKITSIIVENYRSIKRVEITPNQFNIFVGQNNHGKTNFFEAIEWFFSGMRKGESIEDIAHFKKIENTPKVRITFSGAQEAAEKMKHEANATKIKKALSGADAVVIERRGAEKQRIFEVNNKEVSPGTGFDNALNDFLPRFEYISARKFYDEVGKFGKTTPVGIMLSGVLETILEKDQKYQEFRDKFQQLFQNEDSQVRIELDSLGDKVQVYLSKQFPDCSSVKFKVAEPLFEDLLKNFETTVHDGVETTANEKGDGMQRALMLSIIQAYADFRREQEDIGKSFLFLIDEAELHLHPTAQRALKKALVDLSIQGDQVLINTHSSVLVTDKLDYQNLYCVKKSEHITCVDPMDSELDKLAVIYDLLGGSPSDLLLPNNFLIVEGQSEFHFISEVIKRFYPDKVALQIIFASGGYIQQHRSFDAIHKVYNPLWLRPIYKDIAVILCDKPKTDDQQSKLKQFRINYPILDTEPVKLLVLPTHTLEEYYPAPWKKTEQEIAAMSRENDKVDLAKECAAAITQDQFESEMTIVFNSLKVAWDLAYKN